MYPTTSTSTGENTPCETRGSKSWERASRPRSRIARDTYIENHFPAKEYHILRR
jgi:hypothetical protein